MPLFTKCDWSWTSVLESITDRVSRLIVSVVCPWRTSATFTGILAGLDREVGVTVGVTRTDGVLVALATVVLVAVGDAWVVPVTVTVAVAVAVPVAVGAGVEVAVPFVGSDVSGSLMSTD